MHCVRVKIGQWRLQASKTITATTTAATAAATTTTTTTRRPNLKK